MGAYCWVSKERELKYHCLGVDHPEYEKALQIEESLRNSIRMVAPFEQEVLEWANS